MKLNNDCIRDILLYIENKISPKEDSIDFSTLVNDLSKYDKDTLVYHINKISHAGLIHRPDYSEDEPEIIFDLTSNGCQYVDTIRDNKVWRILKEKTKTLSSVSLPLLIKLAESLI